MSDTDTLTLIREFIESNFPLAKERSLKDEDSLLESAIVDSMGVLDIVTFVEEKFGIELTDDDLVADSFESIAGIAALVKERMCAANKS